jgi:hypothetical protein
MSATRGSCLCGGIKFEITGPLLSPLKPPAEFRVSAPQYGIAMPDDRYWAQRFALLPTLRLPESPPDKLTRPLQRLATVRELGVPHRPSMDHVRPDFERDGHVG